MSKDFKVGEIVWTKLRGHPWWPSRVYINIFYHSLHVIQL